MNHTIHNLTQGTPQWHAFRAQHFTASEAPAMLGISAYQSRSNLLKAKATGYTPEVDATTQRRFDAGHDAEAGAREIAEQEIGQDLYPITASRIVDGLALSASYDGATMCEDIVWEHKLANVGLIESLSRGVIPDQYRPQLEQQLMVIGAEKALFMASSGDRTAMECVWYTSNTELRARLIAGWKQFAIDVSNYKHVESPAPVMGRTPETLPALHIEVTGMVTASNLAEYKAHALAVFAGINRDLATDQDFASAESTVKWCADIESRLAAAKQHALSQTASIDDLFVTIDSISAEARATRLELDKLVKARKDSIRVEIVTAGRVALGDHITALNMRIGHVYMPLPAADFAGVIKGRRTLESMRNAVDTELARAKIEANALADKITLNLRALNEKPELAFLFSDVRDLVLKEPEYIAMVVKNRIAEHQAIEAARMEAERTRIATVERIKAESAAKARADAEIAEATAKARAEAKAAADAAAKRASEEAIAKASQTAPVITLATAPPCHQTVIVQDAPVCEIVQVDNPPPKISEERAELNQWLDGLNESAIVRVLHFVRSRYGSEVTA